MQFLFAVRPEVAVLADPEGPVSEDMKTNVTLICDVLRAHPDSLIRVRWFLNDSLLKVYSWLYFCFIL